MVRLSGQNMGLLIGYRGETLDALQYLTNLAINKDSEEYRRIIIDTEEYRSKKRRNLRRLAKRLAIRCKKQEKALYWNHESIRKANYSLYITESSKCNHIQ